MTELKRGLLLASNSVHELLSTAAAQEHDAARRYRAIADLASRRGEGDAAKAAQSLALEAEQRAQAILAKADGRLAIAASEEKPPLSPEMAERWDDLSTSGHLTPYRLFAHAVARVATTFATHAYGASAATSEEVRRAGERLGLEELDRAARLRRERRRAFRQGGGPVSLAALEPHEIDREVLARFTELARLFQGLAARCKEAGDEADAQLLLSLLPLGQGSTAPSAVPPATPEDALRRALRALQATAETLENLAANTSDENVLGSAIRGLEDVVTAIARIGQRLAGPEPASARSEAPSPGRATPVSPKSP